MDNGPVVTDWLYSKKALRELVAESYHIFGRRNQET
jgi:hypothetical protein